MLDAVQVRPAAQPEEPEPRRRPNRGRPDGDGPGGGVPAGVEPVSYQVPGRVILAKVALVVLLALVAWAAPNRTQTQVGLLVAATAAVVAARDVIARQRLRADRSEVVVRRGYAGWRRLAWPQIEAVRIDARTRFGARAELLELDAGEEIYQLSRYELGTDPGEVAAVLESLRTGPADQPG